MFFNYLAYARIGLRIARHSDRFFIATTLLVSPVSYELVTRLLQDGMPVLGVALVALTAFLVHLFLSFMIAVMVVAPFWGWRQLCQIERFNNREIRQVVFEKLSDFDATLGEIDSARELAQGKRRIN
jgi:hypothetical protein